MTREELLQAIGDACKRLNKQMVTIFEIYAQLKLNGAIVHSHIDVIMDLETLVKEEGDDMPAVMLHAGWALKDMPEDEDQEECQVHGVKTESQEHNEELVEKAALVAYKGVFRKTDVSYAEVTFLAKDMDEAYAKADELMDEGYESLEWEEVVSEGVDEVTIIEEDEEPSVEDQVEAVSAGFRKACEDKYLGTLPAIVEAVRSGEEVFETVDRVEDLLEAHDEDSVPLKKYEVEFTSAAYYTTTEVIEAATKAEALETAKDMIDGGIIDCSRVETETFPSVRKIEEV